MDQLASSLTGAVVGAVLGAFGVLGVLVYAVATHPEKVAIWASWIWRGLRGVWKGAEFRYVATDVAAQVNAHLTLDLQQMVSGIPQKKVQIRWTNDAEAVAREKAGTLIVRMRPHQDRLANILHASLVSTPKIVAPTTRRDLDPHYSQSIDLQLCRRLARNLGASAETFFRTDILDPALQAEPGLTPVLEKFGRLDLGGLFIPVFLQELVKVGARNLTEPLPHLSTEVVEFVEFLQTIAGRDPGERVELSFVGKSIRVNVLLVAEALKRGKGARPFHWRVGRELDQGVDTIYVLATQENIPFADEVVEALDADRRVLLQHRRRLKIERGGRQTRAVVISFERNQGYDPHDHLDALLREGKLRVGTEVTATATDVRRSYGLLDYDGLQLNLAPERISWGFPMDCRDHLDVGDEIQVRVEQVDPSSGKVTVDRRPCLENPLDVVGAAPDDVVGEKFAFLPGFLRVSTGKERRFLVGTVVWRGTEIPAVLLDSEVAWASPAWLIKDIALGEELQVVGKKFWADRGVIEVSRKRLIPALWDHLRNVYPRGTDVTATVTRVNSRGVFCELEPGLMGFVPAAEFQEAGLEYRDFKENIKPGQRLYVVVGRVVGGKKERVSLRLQATQGD